MGLVGPNFVGGTGALAFLLVAEVVAATAVVSEAALIYVARKRNLLISLAMIAVQVVLSFAFVAFMRRFDWPLLFQAAGPAAGLCVALGLASVVKARLLARLLGAPVSGWRWPLLWAAAAAAVVGWLVTRLSARFEWLELAAGIPLILAIYGVVIWFKGFRHEDRELFRMSAPAAPVAPAVPETARQF